MSRPLRSLSATGNIVRDNCLLCITLLIPCIISVSHYVTLCHAVPLHYIYRFELDAPVQGIQASTFTLDEVPKTSIEIDADGQRIEFCKDFR